MAQFRGVFLLKQRLYGTAAKSAFLIFFVLTAAACAAGVSCAAGAAFGAADAFFAVFLCLVNIPCGKTDYYGNDYDYDDIFHNDCSFL